MASVDNSSRFVQTRQLPMIVGVALALALGGFLISLLQPWVFPDQVSAEAQQVDRLFQVLLGIGGAIFLLVQGMLLYSVIAFRQRPGDESDGLTIHGNVTLEIVWTAIPAVIVVFLALYSYQVWIDTHSPKDNEMSVEAIGARFAWTFNYEIAINESLREEFAAREQLAALTETESGDLVLPVSSTTLHTYVGQPVVMVMQTQDVIHSFWVPQMRIKQDLLPGRTTEVRFTPIFPEDKTSEDFPLVYRVVCTELCGSGHGDMFAQIVIHENEESYLNAFVNPALDNALNPPDDPVIQGMQLLASGVYPCSGCHMLNDSRDDGRGNTLTINWMGVTGPALGGVGDRAPRRVSGQTAEEYLHTTVYDTDAYLVPGFGNLMNQFQATDAAAPNYMPEDDAFAIIAYLCTLTGTGESTCDLNNLAAISGVAFGGDEG